MRKPMIYAHMPPFESFGNTPPPAPDEALKHQEGGDHYKKMAIQPIEYSEKNGLSPLEHSVVKYVSRHKNKNGKQDLLKAIHSLWILIEMEYPGE